MRYTTIIPAAGSSVRFGKKNKLTIKINGDMLVKHTINSFNDDKECEKIILVVRENEFNFFKKLFCLKNKVIVVAKDTRTRSETVRFGLEYCKKTEYIMIHDACRPFLEYELLNEIKQELDSYDAVIPILKISDSILQNNSNLTYLNRDEIVRVQTPQAFKTKILLDAINQINDFNSFNDEFSQVIFANPKINYKLINGSNKNIKVTYEDDLNCFE
ncbi:MAG: 2-C-methyl-D-erythritol 4-phosphate cytidylyltransferase [Ureaplasma sp.]|nr:2-C-methyl-D-erythritol 4-phosphate cytidylyltransferase [Ureaplasma sp.]